MRIVPRFLGRLIGRTVGRGTDAGTGGDRGESSEVRRLRLKLREVKARYDGAATTTENSKHWANADGLSANAAATADVRRRLYTRARYERANNGYAKGAVEKLARDLIGTGPRLQLTLGEQHRESARRVETAFKRWCRAVGFADTLRVMHEARVTDGECFALLRTNDAIDHPVKLDVRAVECDQVTTPGLAAWATNQVVDGIVHDEAGNPVEYHVLRYHPGDTLNFGPLEYDRVPARLVVHWFRPRRPGQARGVSEFCTALDLFGQMRRFTKAVLTAAEFAAMIAGVMYTDQPPENGPVAVKAAETFEVERGMLLSLAAGWKAEQFNPTQPVSTFGEFKGEVLTEAGRGLNLPRNGITGSSAEYNFSSARMDTGDYQAGVWVERDASRSRVIDRVFRAWVEEAALVPGLVPADLPPVAEWEWDWHWDGFSSIDPVKDATAQEKRLANGVTTLAEECAADGKDWREVMKQRAIEREYAISLGLPDPYPPRQPPPGDSNGGPRPLADPAEADPDDADPDEGDDRG